MKKYTIPQTVFIQMQPQPMLADSVQIVILPGEEIDAGKMEAKEWHAYDVWGEEDGE